ncbi:MAG: nucleoid-structuring protein H-NS [Cyclobacteriaceae bacterium]
MINRIKNSLTWNRLIPIMIICILAVSCKNKKKATDISDTQQVSEEIKEEIEAYEEQEITAEEINPPSPSKAEKISQYFSAIANASSIPEANNNIAEALSMFSSADAVVLIEIYSQSGQVDYDQPTTIKKYLNYLKDQKKNTNKVQDIVYDDNGNVKELVLRKIL